jgi:uncharacterized RDD family membrane protein YckC
MKQNTVRLAVRRLIAWTIDWCVIALYLIILFTLVSPLVGSAFKSSPYAAESLGFLLLTLPVLIYLSATETIWGRTVGKRLLGLRVSGASGKTASVARVILRNCLKLIPWELAHFSIWHVFVFANSPLHIVGYLTLAASYGIAGLYVAGLFMKDGRTFYDKLSRTQII